MYIWVGINVEKQMEDIKKEALVHDRALGFKNSCFTPPLPLHISLKISFEIKDSDFDGVVVAIEEFYSSLAPFDVEVSGIEKYENIIWIRMKNNKEIDALHDDINALLGEKFGIGMHEYDLDYKFHTTLYMDDDTDKIDKAYELIKDVSLPTKLRINRFCIGSSPSGAHGTYSVHSEIVL